MRVPHCGAKRRFAHWIPESQPAHLQIHKCLLIQSVLLSGPLHCGWSLLNTARRASVFKGGPEAARLHFSEVGPLKPGLNKNPRKRHSPGPNTVPLRGSGEGPNRILKSHFENEQHCALVSFPSDVTPGSGAAAGQGEGPQPPPPLASNYPEGCLSKWL